MEFYTPAQIAKMLHVNEITVRRWLRAGKLEGYRLGERLWRVSSTQIEEFLALGMLAELDYGRNSNIRLPGNKRGRKEAKRYR